MKNFLDKKYPDLHKSKPIEKAVKQTGENIHIKDEKIEAYLDRLEKLILDPKKEQKRKDLFDGESRPRALSLLREMVMNKYVRSDTEKKTEGAVNVEERAARDLGMNLEYNEEQRNERQEILVKDLEKSLDNWISYLSDNNEPYPTWFRYYVFRNVLDLGEFDKDKKEFKKRSKGSAGLFPDIDRGALAYIQDIIEATKDEKILQKLQEAQKVAANNNLKEGELLTKEKAEAFSKMSFAKQYTEAIKLNGEITPEMREEIRGKWIKYQQGTDPTALWASLQNKGTAWCTKGFATATTQLQGGDFYVYYTLDKSGQPNIPRIAIRMNGQNQIGEVRGVADGQQNLEGNMALILEEKLKDFGNEADKYKKKSADMKKVTELVKKQEKNEQFTKEDLIFIYEMNSSIEGFGYEKDPRIVELRKQRNPKEDAPIVFECKSDQVAYGLNEINENTKAYIGEWNPEIFKKIPKNIEHLYESFPDKKIFRKEIELTTKTSEEYTKEIEAQGMKIYSYAQDMLKKIESLKNKEKADLVSFSVEQLGFPNGATLEKIYERAKELDLELCPPQVGPELRLNYKDQPNGEYLRIAMDSIADRDGSPGVFLVACDGDGLWLDDDRGDLDSLWSGDDRFVFRSRK
ncbi:MAG: hypothetical protein ABH951_02720 [Patescibacteria group bacterium]